MATLVFVEVSDCPSPIRLLLHSVDDGSLLKCIKFPVTFQEQVLRVRLGISCYPVNRKTANRLAIGGIYIDKERLVKSFCEVVKII